MGKCLNRVKGLALGVESFRYTVPNICKIKSQLVFVILLLEMEANKKCFILFIDDQTLHDISSYL